MKLNPFGSFGRNGQNEKQMMLSIEYEYAHTFETLILRIELPYFGVVQLHTPLIHICDLLFDGDLYTS